MAIQIEKAAPIIIMPGSYGILAPEIDGNHVDSLATVDIGISFPMALRSITNKVGMFTVIDIGKRCEEITDAAIELFKGHGLKEVRLQTANWLGQVTRDKALTGRTEITSKVLREAKDFFDDTIKNALGKQGIEVVETDHLDDPPDKKVPGDDSEQKNSAIFQLETGIQMVKNKEVPYDKLAIHLMELTRYGSVMNAIRGKGFTTPLKCLYRPNLVLSSS